LRVSVFVFYFRNKNTVFQFLLVSYDDWCKSNCLLGNKMRQIVFAKTSPPENEIWCKTLICRARSSWIFLSRGGVRLIVKELVYVLASAGRISILKIGQAKRFLGSLFGIPVSLACVQQWGSVKGDSPIFADTKIGTVPNNAGNSPRRLVL
jgi:hypothetical protein